MEHGGHNAALAGDGVLDLNQNAAEQRRESDEVEDNQDADNDGWDSHGHILPDPITSSESTCPSLAGGSRCLALGCLAPEEDHVDPHPEQGDGGQGHEGQQHARKIEAHDDSLPFPLVRISVR